MVSRLAARPQVRGQRDRRTRTRQALQDAALRLSADKGYDGVTVAAIARACEVSPRTFFNYFPSKDDALVAPGPQQLDALRQALLGRPSTEAPLVALREACIAYAVEVTSTQSEQWRLRRMLVRRAPALGTRMVGSFGQFEAGLAEAVELRAVGDGLAPMFPAVAAAAAVAVLRVAILSSRCGEQPEALPRLVGELFDALAEGLLPLTRPEVPSAASTPADRPTPVPTPTASHP